jgi:L-ascorbate metabolism protein UlaG (beta-lactamase superfamily)
MKPVYLFACAALIFILAACAPAAPAPTAVPTVPPVPATATPAPTPTAAPASTLYYEENAQVEIINSQGTRVLIDVYDPSSLSAPATSKDILLTTHNHSDHISEGFLQSFPGKQIYIASGELDAPGVHITGIMSAHNAGDTMQPKDGTNYLFLIETDGLRIAHFGDIGQEALTAEQLKTLGKIDILITQFSNSFSQMDPQNQKGIKLAEQIQPRLIIPTHNELAAMKIVLKNWAGLAADTPSVRVSPATLPEKTTLLFMGTSAPSFQRIFNLKAPQW